MNIILKLEYFALLLLSIYLYEISGSSYLYFFLLILAPDISMAGYLIDTKTGAAIYNLVHNYLLAVLLYLFSRYFDINALEIISIILLAHISLDRILGFGLKYGDSFKHTHQGTIKNGQNTRGHIKRNSNIPKRLRTY